MGRQLSDYSRTELEAEYLAVARLLVKYKAMAEEQQVLLRESVAMLRQNLDAAMTLINGLREELQLQQRTH